MKDIEKTLAFAEELVKASTSKELSPIQKAVLRGGLANNTYEQIAAASSYSPRYIKQTIAPELWKLFSQALGEKVNKKNIADLLQARLPPPIKITPDLELPGGLLPLDSAYYIDREPRGLGCYSEIAKKAAIVSIKGPREMGKTSLMLRILDRARSQGYLTVSFSLKQAERQILADLDKFLKWLIFNITYKLELQPASSDIDRQIYGSKSWCTTYLLKHVLSQIDKPVVIALDRVELLLAYDQNAVDFFHLLLSWQEEAGYGTKNSHHWEKLRLVIVYSTEAYSNLNINQSLFQVGREIELPYLTPEQVQKLARRHGLAIDRLLLQQLMQLLGGHPYLVHLSLYHLARGEVTFEQLRKTAATDTGIFCQHLHRYLWELQKYPPLAAAFLEVARAQGCVLLEQDITFKLKSLGLVKLQENCAQVSCELYRQYLAERL
ncbi:MAG: AAA-like domain-containing protein [Hormoscilla sp.]